MDKSLHQLRLVIDINPLFAGFYTSQVVWGWCRAETSSADLCTLKLGRVEFLKTVQNSERDRNSTTSLLNQQIVNLIRVKHFLQFRKEILYMNSCGSGRRTISIKKKPTRLQLSHEKNRGWLGYINIGDYTTQLCRDYNEPL